MENRFITPWIILAGLFAIIACSTRNQGQDRIEPLATVHGAPVAAEAFAREFAFARRNSVGVMPQTNEESYAFRKAVLDDLIDRMLVLAAARESGITVPVEQVDRELLRLKAEYHGQDFSEALADGRISQQELRERTRSRLMVERYFGNQVLTRVAVTDAEIESYYKEHSEQFSQPEQVRAAQIVVHGADEAKRILADIHKGASFDEMARRYSLSPDAKVGGDLGFFKRGVMPAIFDQNCFGLGVGKISEVVASEYGFHIFKVLDKKPAEPRPLQKVHMEVERLLLQRKREKAQNRAMLELRAGADSVACKQLHQDAGAQAASADEAEEKCLARAATAHIKINETVLNRLQL